MDDFYRPSAERWPPRAGELGVSFDWRRLRDDVLVPLSRDEAGRYRRYDWPSERLAEWRAVEVGGIVMVEGVYTLRSELRSFYDYAIWVECPVAERLARGLARDGEEARDLWLGAWMPEEDRYAEAERPWEHSELVLDGSGRLAADPTAEFVQLRLRSGASGTARSGSE